MGRNERMPASEDRACDVPGVRSADAISRLSSMSHDRSRPRWLNPQRDRLMLAVELVA